MCHWKEWQESLRLRETKQLESRPADINYLIILTLTSITAFCNQGTVSDVLEIGREQTNLQLILGQADYKQHIMNVS